MAKYASIIIDEKGGRVVDKDGKFVKKIDVHDKNGDIIKMDKEGKITPK